MNAVIFGGGKIARGFVAQLLHQSGFHITFVELNEKLVSNLNKNKKYYVNVMGNQKANEWITDYECISLSDISGIAEALESADIVFTSVGGKNLDNLAKTIASAFELIALKLEKRLFTIITCENWKEPGKQLQEGIRAELKNDKLKGLFEEHVGVSEAVILRSGVEATKEVMDIDKNAVSVTDYWELPIDKNRMKGELISFKGANYKDDFKGFLQQKLYTFNTTNATIAYVGRLRGFDLLSDAANDPEIVALVNRVHSEINPAIAEEMQITLEEQEAFSKKALRKYQDKSVTDFTERHARDPIRKIGPNDRIVGTMRLVEKHNISYDALAITLAAAMFYPVTNPEDPTASQLMKIRTEDGIDAILSNVCKISSDENMGKTVKKAVNILYEQGWLDA